MSPSKFYGAFNGTERKGTQFERMLQNYAQRLVELELIKFSKH